MSQRVGILDHRQSSEAKPRTFVKKEIASLLVARMAAEQISQRVIRMFAPDSIYPVLKRPQSRFGYVPAKMPPREVPGVWFQKPQSDRWKIEHAPIMPSEQYSASS